MESLIGVAYLLTGGALVFFGALLGGGMVKSMVNDKKEATDE